MQKLFPAERWERTPVRLNATSDPHLIHGRNLNKCQAKFQLALQILEASRLVARIRAIAAIPTAAQEHASIHLKYWFLAASSLGLERVKVKIIGEMNMRN